MAHPSLIPSCSNETPTASSIQRQHDNALRAPNLTPNMLTRRNKTCHDRYAVKRAPGRPKRQHACALAGTTGPAKISLIPRATGTGLRTHKINLLGLSQQETRTVTALLETVDFLNVGTQKLSHVWVAVRLGLASWLSSWLVSKLVDILCRPRNAYIIFCAFDDDFIFRLTCD